MNISFKKILNVNLKNIFAIAIDFLPKLLYD